MERVQKITREKTVLEQDYKSLVATTQEFGKKTAEANQILDDYLSPEKPAESNTVQY
jgi:hypothetical protein